MKKVSFGILTFLILFSGCISDSENTQVIFERDKQRIEEYLQQNPITSVKKLEDSSLGIKIFWTEVSESGKKPLPGDTLSVDYVGRLLDKMVFDTSIESVARANNLWVPGETYTPYRFIFGSPFDRPIPGFEFAVSQMEEGDKVIALIPSLYGYGNFEQQGIPRNSPLIFEIDLVEIRGVVEEEEE